MSYLIYSVEDDRDIAHIINLTLSKNPDYQVETFYDGRSFLAALKKKQPNMLVLDMMLPDMDGKDILKYVRSNREYDEMAIIIVSAKRLTIDKVDGLDLGADDYIEKPFDILELMSRVNALYRRHKQTRILRSGFVTLDLDKHVVQKGDETIHLTSRELTILAALMRGRGDVVSREQLLKEIWGTDAAVETRTVDMHIKSIRQKLGDRDGKFIVTVYGVGYKIAV
ncbi:MAG: response regulator transcription factor [Erysipelotrichaceae bacterium]|nr:response regulator transcription factor [Erysipelotrichaceae bacterium]